MTHRNHEEFWRWSLENYPHPGVEEQLLNLQDSCGMDVNVVLWCCWCAGKFEEIPAKDFKLALEEVSAWNTEIVTELRKIRRLLKHPQTSEIASSDLRDLVKKAELQAEKHEQSMLENIARKTLTLADDGSAAHARALRNLSAYAALIDDSKRHKIEASALEALIARIFPQARSRQNSGTIRKAAEANNV